MFSMFVVVVVVVVTNQYFNILFMSVHGQGDIRTY